MEIQGGVCRPKRKEIEMRQFVMMAMLCVAGGASAITAGWTTVGSGTIEAGDKGYSWSLGIDSSASFSVKVTYSGNLPDTFAGVGSWGNLLGLTNNGKTYSIQNANGSWNNGTHVAGSAYAGMKEPNNTR